MNEAELYEKYDLLLPPKFAGGYVVLSLYEKIKNKQLSEQFTTEDIKSIIQDIATTYNGDAVPHSEPIIKNLLHFFLRNVPDQYGKFYLTDHAIRLVELMLYKLNNPYKSFPLKESFDKYFTVRFNEIKSISDLEIKFGREFTAGHKRIINDHLESLEDELLASYEKLNSILLADEQDATLMVKNFVTVFKKFSERAEDITNAISSKDTFLRKLRMKVDEIYQKAADFKFAETTEEKLKLKELQNDWYRATEIYNDLNLFFRTVDIKINNIRKQIIKASGKLTELQENFSRRSHFRLLLKKLFYFCLDNAVSKKGVISFQKGFSLKTLVYEKTQLFYPEYYDFLATRNNRLIATAKDEEYEREQRKEIEKENRRQEIINWWVENEKQRLLEGNETHLTSLITEILQKEDDLFIAQNVAIELVQFASQRKDCTLEILKTAESIPGQNLLIWKMKIRHQAYMVS